MKTVSTIKIAFRALRRNMMRSVLTALGIIIGVAAVIAMTGIGNGAKSQVEAQIAASGYKATTLGGVYEGAHLGDDVLTMISTDVNRHSCTVKIIHANHL